MLDEDQKEMLRTEIEKVRLDASDKESLENYSVERLVENYIELSRQVIKEMENRTDPMFLQVLRYAQLHLTREAVDRIAHLVVLQNSET